MISGTQSSHERRQPPNQPDGRQQKILSESEIQKRIASLQDGSRKHAGLAFRRSREVQWIKTQVIQQWVDDAIASQFKGKAASPFANCSWSTKKKTQVLDFARRRLAPAASDDQTTRAVKQKVLSGGLVEQCLGLKPLTMGVPGQGLLEWALLVISDAPFIEDDPEYGLLKVAVANCEHDIARVGNHQRERMGLMLARATHNLLGSKPQRLAARDTVHAMDTPRFCLSDLEMQRFIAGVHKLIDQLPLEDNEMDVVERFTPHLQRHVPPSMRADFDDFVDILNTRRE